MGKDKKNHKYNAILHREKPPYYYPLNMEIVKVSENFASVKMSFSNEFVNVYGFINGGIIATLADAATANALLTVYDEEMLTTIDLKMTFFRPAKSNICCEAYVKHCGKNLAVCEANIKDEKGRDIAIGIFTYAVRKKELAKNKN